MLMLFTIVLLGVSVLVVTRLQPRLRAAHFVVGVLCLALGVRCAAIFSDAVSEPLVGMVWAEDDKPQSQITDHETDSASDTAQPEVASDQDMLPSAVAEEAQPAGPEGSTEGSLPSPRRAETVTDVKYLTPRPDWVETPADVTGDLHQLTIESGLHLRPREADRALREQLEAAWSEYVNDYLNSSYASTLVGYKIEESKSGNDRVFQVILKGQPFVVARNPFEEQVQVSVGVMNQSHLQVQIPPALRDQLDVRWSEVKATSRLLETGLGASVVLLLLGTLFGYLKLDTATRGYYTGRLQFGAAAVILAVIAASVMVAKWIPWM